MSGFERRGVGHAQIMSWQYNPDTKVLDVRFNRVGHYEYAGVPGDIGHQLMTLPKAEAVFVFDRKVEGTYASKRMGD